jgi:hypothetical protein
MQITFPASPTHGQQFSVGSRTWVYNSEVPAWEALPLAALSVVMMTADAYYDLSPEEQLDATKIYAIID